ncbi:MAG: hypothetical protein HOH19_08755 [Kordiimonadaceae bacterium]|nr:hypothetical protein [Kordiimonadaceae bacterium]
MDAAVEIVDDITSSNISDFFIVNVEQNDAATPQILSTETSTNLTLFAALFVWVAGICLNIASITQELIYSIKFTNKIKLKPIANEFLPIKWPLENSAFRTPRPMDVTYSTNTFICNMVVSICTYSIKTNIDRT